MIKANATPAVEETVAVTPAAQETKPVTKKTRGRKKGMKAAKAAKITKAPKKAKVVAKSDKKPGRKPGKNAGFDLAGAIKAKAGDASVASLAQLIKVKPLALKRVLSGKSKPNARTVGAYAKYLGVDAAEILGRPVKGAKGNAAKNKAAKQPKAGKKPSRRGRAPGRRPGSSAGGGQKGIIGGKLNKAINVIQQALEEKTVSAAPVDVLAQRVMDAPIRIKRAIEMILKLA
jgi:transcriptional regulator with XRE-family HTH domain